MNRYNGYGGNVTTHGMDTCNAIAATTRPPRIDRAHSLQPLTHYNQCAKAPALRAARAEMIWLYVVCQYSVVSYSRSLQPLRVKASALREARAEASKREREDAVLLAAAEAAEAFRVALESMSLTDAFATRDHFEYDNNSIIRA